MDILIFIDTYDVASPPQDRQAPSTASVKRRRLSLHLQYRPRGGRGLYTSQAT